jgi:hypothetical protein
VRLLSVEKTSASAGHFQRLYHTGPCAGGDGFPAYVNGATVRFL